MDLLSLREPLSAGSHGAWLLLSLPATLWLWLRSRHDRSKQISLLVYGASLSACFGASTLFHGMRVPGPQLDTLALIDHIGIYLLIAGTYTPIAWNLLSRPWKHGVLALAWLAAAGGSTMQVLWTDLPIWMATSLYLVMGWGAVVFYAELERSVNCTSVRLILWGGVFYSVGAAINLLEWPVLWPGVFGAHELFHLFVMAGSLCHFTFMLTVVAPRQAGLELMPEPSAPMARPAARPRTVLALSVLPARSVMRGPHWRTALFRWLPSGRP